MKEGEQGVWRSFHVVDPKNWPELPPPIIEIRRRKGSGHHRPVGTAVPFGETAIAGLEPAWQKILALEPSGPHFVIREQKREQDNRDWGIRREGIELIQRFKVGEISYDDVRGFYSKHAAELIPKKQYEMYQDYRKREGQEVMPWGDYARLVVPELFMADFIPFLLK